MNCENPVVLDVGSESLKAGYASAVPSESEPRLVMPSLVTVQPRGGGGGGAGGPPRLARVVQRGSVTSLDHLDALLHYALYDQLGWVKGEEGAALFVEPLFVGKAEREHLVQLMFEGFNVAGLFLHDAPTLALFAAGKLSGCAVDIGHGKVDVATVAEGVCHAPGAVRMSFAGEDLTRLLGTLLAQRGAGLQQQQQQQQLGPALPPPPRLGAAQLGALKVQCARVAPSAAAFDALRAGRGDDQHAGGGGAGGDPGGTSASAAQQQQQQQQQQQDGAAELPPLGVPQEYTLPDGTRITVGAEGATVGEALLRPAACLGLHTPGLADCILGCVAELPDASAKRSALDAVLLCGGGACMPGLRGRVAAELAAQLPGGLAPTMANLPEYMCLPSPQYAPWVGGAVMAKLVAYQSHFMIKAEYEELGPACVHRKCA